MNLLGGGFSILISTFVITHLTNKHALYHLCCYACHGKLVTEWPEGSGGPW